MKDPKTNNLGQPKNPTPVKNNLMTDEFGITYKRCSGCGEYMTLDKFNNMAACKKTGKQRYCRECNKKNMRTHQGDTACVYTITFPLTDKVYVGSTRGFNGRESHWMSNIRRTLNNPKSKCIAKEMRDVVREEAALAEKVGEDFTYTIRPLVFVDKDLPNLDEMLASIEQTALDAIPQGIYLNTIMNITRRTKKEAN